MKRVFLPFGHFLRRRWIEIVLILALLLILGGDNFTVGLGVKPAFDRTNQTVPTAPPPASTQPQKEKPTGRLSEQQASKTENKSNAANSFGLFGNSSISAQRSTRLVQADEATIAAYLKRFGHVAVNEMEKYNVPASILLAQALYASQAGTSSLAKIHNNQFHLWCDQDWEGASIRWDGHCRRKYNTAWDGFRNHTIYLAQGRFQHLTLLDKTDYSRWAKGLEFGGYSSERDYAERLIQIINLYNLAQYDHKSMHNG